MRILELDHKPDHLFEDLNNSDNSKKYVRVIADHIAVYDNKSEKYVGVKKPLILVHHGTQYLIDQVSEPIRCASLKSGGLGLRYRCRIRNTQIYLFSHEDGLWSYEKIA